MNLAVAIDDDVGDDVDDSDDEGWIMSEKLTSVE